MILARFYKAVFTVLFVACFLMVFSMPARAHEGHERKHRADEAMQKRCQCLNLSTQLDKAIYNEADLVIRGHAIRVSRPVIGRKTPKPSRARVRILESYKGKYYGEIDITYNADKELCGFGPLRQGAAYNMILHKVDDEDSSYELMQGACRLFTPSNWVRLKSDRSHGGGHTRSDEAVCQRQGGQWKPRGEPPEYFCNLPTSDGGKFCLGAEDCEGECIASLNDKQISKLVEAGYGNAYIETFGKCSKRINVFGCWPRVQGESVIGLSCKE